MRQTKKHCVFSLLKGLIVALLFLGLPIAAVAQSAAFQDLPPDHWAFSDVDFLVSQGYMDGYPDGTFKGRKVTTRYDMALILARILKRMEERKSNVDTATEEERASLGRLTREFRDELGLLDIRVDSLERRMVDNENKVKNLERKLPKVRIWGFYRSRGQYILDPGSVTVDETGDDWEFSEPGLVTFYQQMYLRFTSKPLDEKLDIFYEVYGLIFGNKTNILRYNEAGGSTPNAFDNIDSYVTGIDNEKRISSNRLHIVSRAKSMKFRVFSNEGINGLNDPMNLISEDSDNFDPYHGLEVSGSEGGFSYQGQIYKTDLNYGSSDESNALGGRLVWKLPEKFSEDSLSIGTTYAEKIYDYKNVGNSNAVRATDISYSTDRIGRINATAEILKSEAYLVDGSDGSDGLERGLDGGGSRFDMSIQNGGFTGTFKHYDYDRNFRAYMAPAWAYDIEDTMDYPRSLRVEGREDNYGREDFIGEELTRFSLNYDFENKVLKFADNLSIETTYLTKSWEEDPFNPDLLTDGRSGKKLTFQILSDFTDSTTLKYDFAHKKEAYQDEDGEKSNTFELNLKLSDSVNSKGTIFILDDPDDVDELTGSNYSERIGYFELNSDINPRVYAKGSVEHQVRWANATSENVRVDYIGEVTYNLNPTTSLTGGIQHIDFDDNGDSTNSSLGNAILAELKKNFTNKFRGRAFYSRGVIDYKEKGKDSIDRENIYAELIYDVSKDAKISFKFGYDYPDEWRWAISSVNNGRDYEDVGTQKMFIFEANSNF